MSKKPQNFTKINETKICFFETTDRREGETSQEGKAERPQAYLLSDAHQNHNHPRKRPAPTRKKSTAKDIKKELHETGRRGRNNPVPHHRDDNPQTGG